MRLVRIRNPWGNEVEWRGAWSDNSYEWSAVSKEIKDALKYRKLADGEFWMSFDDFYRNFESIQFCELTPDAYSVELLKKQGPNDPKLTWKMTAYNGAWVPGKNSGGCGRTSEMMYWTNPQFLITLKDADPNDNENMATIIVSLMQKFTREKRSMNNGEQCEEFIQFRLYRVLSEKDAAYAKNTGKCLYASQLERCGVSGPYINLREVTKRFRTAPGNYLVIPSCYDENISGEFLLRVYTENAIDEPDCCILHDDFNNNNISNTVDAFFSTPKSIDSEFSNWANLINGSDDVSRLTNDFTTLRSTANTITVNNTITNTKTNTDQMILTRNQYYRPKTSSPVFESKLYTKHTFSNIYDKVNVKRNPESMKFSFSEFKTHF